VRYADDPTGKPIASSQSPHKTSIGTFVSPFAATVADATMRYASGIAARTRHGRVVDDDEEAMRDLRAMVSPFAEVTVLASARVVTNRAGLADRRTPTDEPEGSPARPAAERRDCATRRCGDADAIVVG
jgi:hypothetical protein